MGPAEVIALATELSSVSQTVALGLLAIVSWWSVSILRLALGK